MSSSLVFLLSAVALSVLGSVVYWSLTARGARQPRRVQPMRPLVPLRPIVAPDPARQRTSSAIRVLADDE